MKSALTCALVLVVSMFTTHSREEKCQYLPHNLITDSRNLSNKNVSDHTL
jgi:hypothetical protein